LKQEPDAELCRVRPDRTLPRYSSPRQKSGTVPKVSYGKV